MQIKEFYNHINNNPNSALHAIKKLPKTLKVKKFTSFTGRFRFRSSNGDVSFEFDAGDSMNGFGFFTRGDVVGFLAGERFFFNGVGPFFVLGLF